MLIRREKAAKQEIIGSKEVIKEHRSVSVFVDAINSALKEHLWVISTVGALAVVTV